MFVRDKMASSSCIRVLNCAMELQPHATAEEQKGVQVKRLPLTDHGGTEDALLFRRHIAPAMEFIGSRPPSAESPVLIHCVAGASRSPSMAAAYLTHSGIARDLDDAIEAVRSRRCVAL